MVAVNEFSMNFSKKSQNSQFKFKDIHTRSQNHLKLYTVWRTILVDSGLYFAIAHRNFVSIYDILTKKWTFHKAFADHVRGLEVLENRKVHNFGNELSSISRAKQNGVLFLVVQEGINRIHECMIQNGRIKELKMAQDKQPFAGEMIKTVCQYKDIDNSHSLGLILLL